MQNQKILLIAILIGSVLGPFLSSAMNVALPFISNNLKMNATELGWVNMAFLLASAAFCIPFGKIADIIGLKKIFIIGNIIILFTSIACVLVVDKFSFLSFRFFQGMGSAMLFVSATALITSAFPKEKRGKFLGYNITAVYLGLSIAPALGGIIIQVFNWHSLFYLGIINSLAVLVLMIFYKAEKDFSKSKTPFDFKGSLIYVIFMSMLMYGFANITNFYAQVLTFFGAIGIVFFVYFESRQVYPVFDVKFFASNRKFAFSNLAALINYAATFATGFLLSLYLQYSRGLQPASAGAILMLQPVSMAFIAILSGRLSDKYDSKFLASGGMLISAIGVAMLIFTTEVISFSYIYFALVILGIGFGFFSTPNTHAVMNSVEPKQFGMASATISTMRLSGQMFSMGLATLFINVFIGTKSISAQNAIVICDIMKYVFLIFFILMLFGIYFSWARGKKK